MEIVIRPRLGIGFDIEHNEEICYRAHVVEENGKQRDALLCYIGIIIKLPFVTVYIGEFHDESEMASD